MKLSQYSKVSIALFIALVFGPCGLWGQQMLVNPYLQPGNTPSLSKEEKVLIWQTDSVWGEYTVECTPLAEKAKTRKAKVAADQLKLNGETTWLYRAKLTKLKFDQAYNYKVTRNGSVVAEQTFTTRTKEPRTKFVVIGDCGAGTPEQAQIANQIHSLQPQFLLMVGDNVYDRGRAGEYRKNFFPYFNASTTSEQGAPLMSSIPFYLLLGNHDVYASDLTKYPDGLAYFYYNDLPVNAPKPVDALEATGGKELVDRFEKVNKGRFPKMANYSFDVGNVHIVCLDANSYINPTDPSLMQWFIADMQASKADWKIVAFHQPGFNSSNAHYDYQKMRLLSPVMERLGVDLVMSGHVHNYQRSHPMKFDPQRDESGLNYVVSPEGRVDGKFTMDTNFDGVNDTTPEGIIYIVTGAGGRALYDAQISDNPELWKHEPDSNWVPFTVKLVSNKHSFTWVETESKRLTLKQLDKAGALIDQIVITK